MLQKIVIKGFKCFDNYTINLSDKNIIVGKNNAGKSTIGEAIRIISLATSTYKGANYNYKPDWLKDEPISEKGFIPSQRRLKHKIEKPTYRYEEIISTIEGFFKNKTRIKVFLNYDGEIFCKIYQGKNTINSRDKAKNVSIPLIKVMPSLRPLVVNEQYYDPEYVNASHNEKNLSIHFRNLLHNFRNDEKYKEFTESISLTWPKINISDLYIENNQILLNVRDESFVAEISQFGDGIQIWMQMIWFVSSLPKNVIVFLDEPDVYLHADLQKKLYTTINNKFDQFIVATHSVEIISEASINEIIEIDKNQSVSKCMNNIDELQEIISSLGSYANVKIQKILENKKLVYVEGKDTKLLKLLAEKIADYNNINTLDIQYDKLDGRGNLNDKLKSLIRINSNKLEIDYIFIVDNDYFGQEYNDESYELAKQAKVFLKIWEKKEIENYLCNPRLLVNSISKKYPGKISKEIIIKILINSTEQLKNEYINSTSDNLYFKNRKKNPSTHRSEVEKKVNEYWDNLDFRLNVLSGKTILEKLFGILKEEYDISLSKESLIYNLEIDDLDNEIIEIINRIYDLKQKKTMMP